ncbi:ubiquitin-protein ligase [Scheffersomyces xylosifermentans]|uniref:ubiquitin-protein ligase n=1 Tax=Scheffersomyces xylosifermentans TaxID=1304137 RepID=UPI00315CBFEE
MLRRKSSKTRGTDGGPPGGGPISSKHPNSESQNVPRSSNQWRLKDLLKIPSAPTKSSPVTVGTSYPVTPNAAEFPFAPNSASIPKISPSNSSLHSTGQSATSVSSCHCCGTLLTYPLKAIKFRCSVCNTTNLLTTPKTSGENLHLISYQYVKKMVDKSLEELVHGGSDSQQNKSIHDVFEPLSNYLYEAFKSYECLNNSFTIRRTTGHAHYHSSNINYEEVRNLFILLSKLPTKRPLYNALRGSSHLLKRIYVFAKDDDPRSFLWILILLEIPFLSRALVTAGEDSKPHSMTDVPEIRALCYDILKRCLGILASSDTVVINNYIASWLSKQSYAEFTSKIDLLNLYITFHLKKYFYLANNPHLMRRMSSSSAYNENTNGTRNESQAEEHPTDREYAENINIKEEIDALNQEAANHIPLPNSLALPASHLGTFPARSKSKKGQQDTKIKIYQYGNDWHIKTGATVLSTFLKANAIREEKVSISTFYNSLVDFVNMKLDFDSWQSNKKSKVNMMDDSEAGLQQVIDYIHGTTRSRTLHENASYFFCQYPFLITLGGKISILEYEARRQMERKAEEAFINSLDKRIAIDIYFKVRVRREYMVQDSLQCIKLNSNNLKKSLKVQFVNEPGVDVGGLKKEWFLLLTRSLFNPQTGMLFNVDDSNFLWFNIVPIEDFEMYYLFGAVLGLAIYNSTILDLQFPLALYKILLDKPVGLADYKQLFPVSYENLMKLKTYSLEELLALDLTFEVNYKDLFGKQYTSELISNGKNTVVTPENCKLYIETYVNFFLNEGIKKQITAFANGFKKVVGGNALSLFSPEEIQLLLCGSEEGGIDVDILKSITKYVGWNSAEDALNSDVIQWFWEYMGQMTLKEKKRVLVFVTGSDRVPATGIQNLNFKISTQGKDTGRLPLAHTCFNELALYNYTTKHRLVDKLSKAVNESAGFGIK